MTARCGTLHLVIGVCRDEQGRDPTACLPRRDDSESSGYQTIAAPALGRLDRPSLGETGLW